MQTTAQKSIPTVRPKYENPKLLILSCIVCLLTVGIPYWIIPYSQTNLPSSLSDISLLVVAIAAFWVRAKNAIDIWMGASIVGSTVPAVVMIRVIVETSQDPTSHNLWPFEIMIAAFFGYAYAIAGTLAGHFYARSYRSRK